MFVGERKAEFLHQLNSFVASLEKLNQ